MHSRKGSSSIFFFLLILTSRPAPAAKNHPYSVTVLPLCFTVQTVLSRGWAEVYKDFGEWILDFYFDNNRFVSIDLSIVSIQNYIYNDVP